MSGSIFKALGKKRRRSAGRPPKEGVERYPSGDIKRGETEREAKAVVIDARMRHHALDEQQAKSDLAGSVLGRIYMDKKINKVQFEAGQAYCEDVLRYFAYYLGTSATEAAQNILKVRGFDGDTTKRQHDLGAKALDRMMRIDIELLKDGPGAKTSIFNICVRDEPKLRYMPASQMALLRRSLDRLVWFYGISNQ